MDKCFWINGENDGIIWSIETGESGSGSRGYLM